MSDYVDCSIADLQYKRHGDKVSTTGIISCIEDQRSAAGAWVTATLRDGTGSVALNVYPDEYVAFGRLVNSGSLVRVSGFKQIGGDDWDSFAVNVQEVTA